jgi:signal transduction histidine kinase
MIHTGSAPFEPRARLLKLIGAELISDEVVAITELVKNAHDADADSVTISFRDVTGPDGEISIRDDGSGMDLDAILTRWMQPAGSSKTGEDRRITPRGRRVLGEKGVGRFAADKLARTLDLVSRQAGDPREVFARFDWDAFDDEHRLLSEVHSQWEVRPARDIAQAGTLLRMKGLRAPWTERTFRRLCTRLARLRSPFRLRSDFNIKIESDEFPDYAGDLRADFMDKAPYRIDASFDGEQTISLSINGEAPSNHLWNGQGELRCGPVRARLFAFDLETEALGRIGPRADVRAWLREWSGISIYRDNFRVWPYGEPHDDWLRLDQRRVNNPVVRLSNNQIVGFIEIGRDGNADLVDQTNREGLINNPAFEDLRRLMYFVLQTLEAERQTLRHPKEPRRSKKGAGGTVRSTLADSLESLAGRADADMAEELTKLAQKAREMREMETLERQRLVDGFADLAAAGQAATIVSQLVSPMLDELRSRCRELRRESGSSELLRAIEDHVYVLGERFAMMLPSDSAGARRRRTIDLAGELEGFRTLITPLILEHGASVVLDVQPGVSLKRVEMRPEVFQRLLYTLTLNSLDWTRGKPSPEIRLTLRGNDEECELIFADNGPGIAPQHAERVFEPLFSTKEGGRGMGLAIARNIMESHGGTIEVMTDRRRRGANVLLCWRRKRSRATIAGR